MNNKKILTNGQIPKLYVWNFDNTTSRTFIINKTFQLQNEIIPINLEDHKLGTGNSRLTKRFRQ